jgi:hypothetical protein
MDAFPEEEQRNLLDDGSSHQLMSSAAFTDLRDSMLLVPLAIPSCEANLPDKFLTEHACSSKLQMETSQPLQPSQRPYSASNTYGYDGNSATSVATDEAYGSHGLSEAVLKEDPYRIVMDSGDQLSLLKSSLGTPHPLHIDGSHLQDAFLGLDLDALSSSLDFLDSSSDGLSDVPDDSNLLRSSSSLLSNEHSPFSQASSPMMMTTHLLSTPSGGFSPSSSRSAPFSPYSSHHSQGDYEAAVVATPLTARHSSTSSSSTSSSPPRLSTPSSSSSSSFDDSPGALAPSASYTLSPAQSIQEILDSKGSWNERFQFIFDAPDSEMKFDALHRLYMDFLGVAETYGKVIIAERSLPDEEKSIKPINIGGMAGGSKFSVRGLLFKFAIDGPPHFLYGSDEYAQKAASHELKGLNQWSLNSEGLHFPLMALVRYCGFTLVAMSMLPIGNGSLVYGSGDAGKTVHFDDDVMYEKMKKAATNLNLKGHFLIADPSKLMYGPGDIEGHFGSDHLHYVLDFARVYPPAATVPGESNHKSRCLFRLLRPELVSRFQKPLSSDAFTGWGRCGSDIHNTEVRQATQFLIDETIPSLAQKLLSFPGNPELIDYTREFHLHGVNVRYMGLVRRVIYTLETRNVVSSGTIIGNNQTVDMGTQDKCVHVWLLREMVARTLKSILNRKWRELNKKYQRITPDRCIQEAVGVLNTFVDPQTTPASISFWGKGIRHLLNTKFPLALIDSENAWQEDDDNEVVAEVDLQQLVLGFEVPRIWRFMFTRISHLTGMVFGDFLTSPYAKFPTFGLLTPGDIVEIRSYVKQMSLVDFAYVMAKALNALRQVSSGLASRLLALAIVRLKSSPDISLLVVRRLLSLKPYIINTLKRMKWVATVSSAVIELVEVAFDGASLLVHKLPTDLTCDAALFLHELHSRPTSVNPKIISYLQRTINIDPAAVRPNLEMAKILASVSRPTLSPEIRIWIDRSISVAPNDILVRLQIGLLILTLPNSFNVTSGSDGGSKHDASQNVHASNMSAIDEVLAHWNFVKRTDASTFRKIDLHLFTLRYEEPSPSSKALTQIRQSSHTISRSVAIEKVAQSRAKSFAALIFVSCKLDCPELKETIKKSILNDFSSLVLASAGALTWNAEMLSHLASMGPFPHFSALYIPKHALSLTIECEIGFGHLLAECPNLSSLRIVASFEFDGRHFLKSLANPSKLETLDLTGTSVDDKNLDLFVQELLSSSLSSTSIVDPKLSLKTLLLPSTVSAHGLLNSMNLMSEVCRLEHLRTSPLVQNPTLPIVMPFSSSLVMLSVCDANGLTIERTKELLSALQTLLLFDGSGSPQLSDSALVPLLSTSSLHPTMELFISSTGVNYLFTGAHRRRVRIVASSTMPVNFSLSIYCTDWSSLPLLQYTKNRDVLALSSLSGTLTLITVDKSVFGGEPLKLSTFGRSTNFGLTTSSISAESSRSHTIWKLGTVRIAEIAVPNNLATQMAEMQWISNGDLATSQISASLSNVLRIKLSSSDMQDQQLVLHTRGSAADFELPPGFSASFWAVALLSFMRLLLL